MDTKSNKHTESAHGSDYAPSPQEIAIGYELRDTHLKPVLVFVVIFWLTVIASFLIVIGVEAGLNKFEAYQNRVVPAAHALSLMPEQDRPPNIPPGPLLEPSPGNPNLPQQDLQEVRDRAKAKLDSYGNVSNGFVRIPLTSAMDMVVANGLPTKLPATQPSAGPTMPPASAQHGPGGVP